jgi:hypothetical protein
MTLRTNKGDNKYMTLENNYDIKSVNCNFTTS